MRSFAWVGLSMLVACGARRRDAPAVVHAEVTTTISAAPSTEIVVAAPPTPKSVRHEVGDWWIDRVAKRLEPIERYVDPARGLAWYADEGSNNVGTEARLQTYACGVKARWRLAVLRDDLAFVVGPDGDAKLHCDGLVCSFAIGDCNSYVVHRLYFDDDPVRGLTLIGVTALDESEDGPDVPKTRAIAEAFIRSPPTCP